MVGNQGDIHVIFDYQNVIYIDPNKVINGNQEVLERGLLRKILLCMQIWKQN